MMPKPIAMDSGSGHARQREPLEGQDQNIVLSRRATEGELSQTARYFCGGISQATQRPCLPYATPPQTPTTGWCPGYEAPVYIAWSSGNRSAIVQGSQSTSRERTTRTSRGWSSGRLIRHQTRTWSLRQLRPPEWTESKEDGSWRPGM